MQKHRNQLVARLINLVETKQAKISQFSRDTGIPAGRVYKWIKEGNNPKVPDEKKLSSWLNGDRPINPTNSLMNELQSHYGPLPKDHEKYVALLERTADSQEKVIRTLEESIQLSLNHLLRGQSTTLEEILILKGFVRAGLLRGSERYAQEDPKKVDKEQDILGKHVAYFLRLDEKMGK